MLFILHILILFFGLLRPLSVKAVEYFKDDFTSIRPDIWELNYNNADIEVKDGIITLSSDQYHFPYVIKKGNDIFPKDSDFIIDIRFKFSNVDHMGDGIGIGFTNAYGSNFYQFQMWRGLNDGFYFVYNDFNTERQGYCNNFQIANNLYNRKIIPIQTLGDWHTWEIKKENSRYEIYVDKNKIFSSESNQCIPQNIWFGNKLAGGSFSWTTLQVDYIKVYSLSNENKKVIVIPGLGASWNTKAMILNENVQDNEWKLAGYAKNYNGLTKSLEDNGLIKDKDYFVWTYDWRKPADTIKNKFAEFVDANISEDDKLSIVGHSLGGVVARLWQQDHAGDKRLEKIITLGSPHKGSLDAYDVWNGTKFPDDNVLMNVALKIYIEFQRFGGKTELNTLRNTFPVLKDLLPTEEFAKKNNIVVKNDKLNSFNSYLTSKNLSYSNNSLVKNYSGNGFKSKEWVILSDRSVFDKVLGLWPDGKPVSYLYGDGDGTVLTRSAILDTNNFYQLNSDHSAIVDKSLSKILEDLGLKYLENNSFGTRSSINDKYLMVAYTDSPVEMKMDCNGDLVQSENGFAVFEYSGQKTCTVSLNTANNTGYKLVLGSTRDYNTWSFFEGNVSRDQAKSYSIADSGKVININANEEDLVGFIRRDIEKLLISFPSNKDLKAALVYIEKKDALKTVDSVFKFRKTNKEALLTGGVIDNLEILLAKKNVNCSTSDSNKYYLKLLQDKSLIDSLTRINTKKGNIPSRFSSESYDKAERLVDQVKKANLDKQCPQVISKSITGSKYYSEIW